VQGFLRKLGIERSYVMINAFLYSVFGQHGGERHAESEPIIEYRHRWMDALLGEGSRVQSVVAFGHLAEEAFDRWADANPGRAADLAVERLTHPTMPEAASRGDPARRRAAMRRLLEEWNGALRRLDDALTERDEERELVLYGDDLTPGDRAPIPEFDLPAGSPPWMRSLRQWAARRGNTVEDKRACIEVVVPREERPWEPFG
jgi:hypothetical protein